MIQIPFDKYGLITERDGNGGDSANRMGLYFWIHWMLGTIAPKTNALKYLEPYPLVFIRHPEKSKDANNEDVRDFANWNDWNNFSRDQWLPLTTAIGLLDANKYRQIMRTTFKRYGILSNGDILGPTHYAHVSRISNIGNKISFFKIIGYYIADSFSFMGYFFDSFKSSTSHSLNGFLIALTAYKIHPTLVSKLNLKLIKYFCRYPQKWEIYFGHENGCQLHTIAKPLFDKYL